MKEYHINAINFSSYGASFVYLDESGNTIAPLYNYLKPYDQFLQKKFYNTYGGEVAFSHRTASPVLGNLNSGMQLYRIKYQKPELFAQIKTALHLPQYLGYLISGRLCSDITSIGCHTNLWDFTTDEYHQWVHQEGIDEKLAPLIASDAVFPAEFAGNNFSVGVGLHDSSAAIIPYLINFHEPFILISTGTWCISLNPFNDSPLTTEELQSDCLCYMTYQSKPVKASRLFAGYVHEQQVKRIADHFNTNPDRYRSMKYDPEIMEGIQSKEKRSRDKQSSINLKESGFIARDLSQFDTDIVAYHQLVFDLVIQQYASTHLVLTGTKVKRIFVDGGFSGNLLYMNLLASFFPALEVFAASMAQATAIGTALSIHNSWNSTSLPQGIIELKHYGVNNPVA